MLGHRKRCLTGLLEISCADDRHVRQHGHHPHVFKDLMRCTVFSQREPRMGSTNLDILPRVGNGLADLVINATGREIRECSSKWDFPTYGHAGCHAHHVGFGNPNLKEPFGKRVFEATHFQ